MPLPKSKKDFYQESGFWRRYKTIYGKQGESDTKLAQRTNFWSKWSALSTAQRETIIQKSRAGKPLTKRQQYLVKTGNQLLVEIGFKEEADTSVPGDTPTR